MRRIGKYLHEIMSEPDGSPSFGRWCSAFFAVCAAGWISYVVFRKHELPDTSNIPTLVGAPYGTNKVLTMAKEAVAAWRNNGGRGTEAAVSETGSDQAGVTG